MIGSLARLRNPGRRLTKLLALVVSSLRNSWDFDVSQ